MSFLDLIKILFQKHFRKIFFYRIIIKKKKNIGIKIKNQGNFVIIDSF